MRPLLLAGFLLASCSFAQATSSEPATNDLGRRLDEVRARLAALTDSIDRLETTSAATRADLDRVRANTLDVSARVYALACFTALSGTALTAVTAATSCDDPALPSAKFRAPRGVSSRLRIEDGRLVVSVTSAGGSYEVRNGRLTRLP